MSRIFVHNDYLISALGFGSPANMEKLFASESGLKRIQDKRISETPLPLGQVDDTVLNELFEESFGQTSQQFTRCERLFLVAIQQVLHQSGLSLEQPDTLLILSTTKGNIDVLEGAYGDRIPQEAFLLPKMTARIAHCLKAKNAPLLVSNACISGLMALNIGARYIQRGTYKNVIVAGADIASKFTVSGFQAFKALSEEPCKPFDVNRTGLTLGEGAGAMLLSSEEKNATIEVIGWASSNDANHISGPSRTGEGLYVSIQKAMKKAEVSATDIDFISAHGTATPYNDAMEAKAFSRSALEQVPVNSLKGYWGHTLGAAGLIEAIATIHSMEQGKLVESKGYQDHGVDEPIAVIHQGIEKELNCSLKTASGFGGCNAATIFRKK